MIKNILVTFVFISSTILIFAQSETVKPTYGVNIEREIFYAKIENNGYHNVTVELRAAELNDYFVSGVKVIVTDNQTGKIVYKKRFPKSYLYAFSSGTIEVGKGNALTQVILSKSDGLWIMGLKEKGIY